MDHRFAALALAALAVLAAAPPAAAQAPLPAPVPPSVTAGPQGFSLVGEKGDFTLRLRTLVQADGRFYSDGPETDGFLVRRARIELTGTLYRRFDFRVMPDLSGSSTTLLDAWLRWRLSPELQVQVGKVKLPIGLEREQSPEHNLFAEFGYPTALVPNRDVGINLQGRLRAGGLTYYVGVFDGTADGASTVSDGDDERELAARLFATPFAADDASPWGGLGFGLAGTWGEPETAPSAYRTVGQQTFFRWRAGVVNDGDAWRLVPQAHLFRGPFGLLAEHALSSQELELGDVVTRVEASAWTVNVTWVATGEEVTFHGVEPRRPIGAEPGGRGAWQLVARATELEVEDSAFPLFADPAGSARRARTLSAGVHWILNRAIRLTADYNRTELDGGPIADEQVVIARAQVRF